MARPVLPSARAARRSGFCLILCLAATLGALLSPDPARAADTGPAAGTSCFIRLAAAGPIRAAARRRLDFEQLPSRPEPGVILDAPLRAPGLWLGERLVGQRLGQFPGPLGNLHDGPPVGAPRRPLAVLAGPAGQNLAVAHHPGLGSNALFPVGPAGAASRRGRGEGAATLLFDVPQTAIALRIHTDYADPLGARRAPAPFGPGNVRFLFIPGDGPACALSLALGPGASDIGFRATSRALRAVVIWNADPGGIAIDDIAYDATPPTG